MKKFMIAFILFVSCMPLVSLAHPGHGDTEGFSITHYIVEPIHLLVSITVLSAVALYIRHLSRNRKKKESI
jgi:hypothetical protein